MWRDVSNLKDIDDEMDNFFNKWAHNRYMEDAQIFSNTLPFDQNDDQIVPSNLKQQFDVKPEMRDTFYDLTEYDDEAVLGDGALKRYQIKQLEGDVGSVKWNHQSRNQYLHHFNLT